MQMNNHYYVNKENYFVYKFNHIHERILKTNDKKLDLLVIDDFLPRHYENLKEYKNILQIILEPYGSISELNDTKDVLSEYAVLDEIGETNKYYAIISLQYGEHIFTKHDKIRIVMNRLLIINSNNIDIKFIKGLNVLIFQFTIQPNKLSVIGTIIRKEPKTTQTLENKTLNPNIIVIDKFYENPDNVRKFALSNNIEILGNYPGKRTQHYPTYEIKHKLQSIMKPYGNITVFEMEPSNTSNGCFQLTTSRDRSWIHIDHNEILPTNWAGVLYLTPDAPLSSGTNIYKFKDSQKYNENDYSQDMTKWDLIDSIGNVYNRIIIFNAKKYHMSGDYFGLNNEDGRLTQVFFFRLE